MGLEISSSCLMQSMRDIDLPSAIDTSRHDITREFFAPLLSCATRYDRGVGFFSSGWLRINAVGMAAFAANQGRFPKPALMISLCYTVPQSQVKWRRLY